MPRTDTFTRTAVCGLDSCSREPRRVAVTHEVPIGFRAWDSATKSWAERRTIHNWHFCSVACFEAWCDEVLSTSATRSAAL